MIADRSKTSTHDDFERDLYVVRRRIEKRVMGEHINDFYICSLSCRSVVYKGMFLAEQLTSFYPDLLDERFISNFAIYHQRYSTNTFPTWRLAQPFRMLAHNGEINTLTGNVKLMKAHEPKIGLAAIWRQLRRLEADCASGSSDSEALDSVFELFARAGRRRTDGQSDDDPGIHRTKQDHAPRHEALFSYLQSPSLSRGTARLRSAP